jgi:uncharacterized protein YeaO (DUF488 family)
MTTIKHELDCTLAVNEIVRRHPATKAVFQRFGVDTCCGGVVSVDEAVRRDGIDREALCAALVERLWPRGVRKADLRLDAWLKDVAPSPALRRWFGHDPDKWPEFKRRYFAELHQHEEALAPLREAAHEGPLTLVYGARDTEHNAAVALREYLSRTAPRGQGGRHHG